MVTLVSLELICFWEKVLPNIHLVKLPWVSTIFSLHQILHRIFERSSLVLRVIWGWSPSILFYFSSKPVNFVMKLNNVPILRHITHLFLSIRSFSLSFYPFLMFVCFVRIRLKVLTLSLAQCVPGETWRHKT